jgi:cellobiose phosphorylase
MKYGYFDHEQKTYVITDPRTPVKWINYIGNLSFGGFVDHTGGALICKGDPALNRITKYIPQMPASDFKGETLYLREKKGGEYIVFSPFFVPSLTEFEHYECHIGLGTTRIHTTVNGIETVATIFVPTGEAREVRDIQITNRRSQPVELDVIPVVEYTHFDALKQLTNADWVPQTMQSWKIDGGQGRAILCQAAFMRKETHVNYFTSNMPVSSFETDRKRFLGNNEYGTWGNPLSLQEAELSNYEARRGDNIGALLHHVGELQPGETQRLIVQLGQVDDIEAARTDIERYYQPQAVDEALAGLVEFWEAYLSRVQFITPDDAMNAMLNVHNPRQCYITKTWSRDLSLYQLGFGGRGTGYRDGSQDVMAIVASAPQEAKDFIRKLLQIQKSDGSAYHQFFQLTMEAMIGDADEREDRPHYYSDDHLWAVLAVCAYLKETGDLEFLDEELPFYDKDEHGQPVETASVLEHLYRAVAFTRGNLGVHGLPLLGFADWNDGINLPTGAESLLTANLYGKALSELIELCRHRQDETAATLYQVDYDEMAARVSVIAWDGDWFVSYFDHDGTPIGSHKNEYAQIFAYGQAWPVMSGFATPEQARSALNAVYERLNTRNGIRVSAPGFNGYDPAKGGVTTYPPGAKENGGIFVHVNPWVMIAETMIGNGQRAYEYYAQTNPAGKNDRLDEYECEPYVYPQNILADEHPQFGLARNSWLSGTASWMYQAATQHILGVRPTYAGLLIDPCIPPDWDGFKAWRQFRRARYNIVVENPQHVSRGIASIEVDGQNIEGNLLPLFTDGRTHDVLVRMG